MYYREVLLLSAESLKREVLCSLILPFVCLLPQSGYSQNPEVQKTPEVITLEQNKPIERELVGGQKHFYQFTLSANEYAQIFVEQRGIDIVLRSFDADGKEMAVSDSALTPQGTETVQITASAASSYKLEIEGKPKHPASRYEIRLAGVRAATEQDFLLQEARVLVTESLSLTSAGKYKEALAKTELALGIREKVLGSEHNLVSLSLNRMGMLYFTMGNHSESEKYLRRALAIQEKQPDRENPDIANTLNNLAIMCIFKGEFTEAETLILRALAIREKVLGPEHFMVTVSLNALGGLYRRRGDNAKALQMHERSLEIRERTLRKDHPELALDLRSLSTLYEFNGDYSTALTLANRALEVTEKDYGMEHPMIASQLTSIGRIYGEIGEWDKAETLHLRALKIYEKILGLEHYETAIAFDNLGRLYFRKGDFAKAEEYYLRVKQVAEKNPGADKSLATLYLLGLGELYLQKGDYAQAEMLLKSSLEIREKNFGETHSFVANICAMLARLYALKGDFAEAVKFQTRANQINEKQIRLNLTIGTEHQKFKYMSVMSESFNQTIALHVAADQENAAVREQAVTAILQHKGRVLDVMTGNLKALRQRLNAEDQVLFDRLTDANARLSELSLNKPQRWTLAEYQKQLTEVQERKDKLEVEINRRSAGFYEISQPITLAGIQALIPTNAALIEFAVYSPLTVKAKDNKPEYAKLRYIAYIVRRQGEVQWKELGDAETIDTAINSFRQALRDKNRQDVTQLARDVDEKLMQPLRALLGDSSHLLVSPDSELNLIPFEALVNEQGRYLIEQYSFTYLTSGRDLLRMQAARQSKNKPLVIANPSFGEPVAEQVAKVNLTTKSNRRNQRRSVTSARDLSDVYFAPLGGAAQEARSIQTLFSESTFLTGAQATESALKQTTSPHFLHIATHGFFLQDNSSGSKIKENPLLRAGLALTGANRRESSDGDDGILTALEASGLNLWGTKLVVLSSCDTGVGEIKNREGVYGLRRAFVLAGTESLVMSMWSVSDYMTRDLMTNYYQNLKQGMGRGAALRQSQLEMLNRKDRQHPFYWASFIQSGEWANLDGKR